MNLTLVNLIAFALKTKGMHIAICVWGLLRSLSYTISDFQQHILVPLINGGHTFDIIMHTYRFSGEYGNVRNGERHIKLNFSEWKLLQPNYVYVENQDSFDNRVNMEMFMTKGDPWKNRFVSFKNHVRAMNSLMHTILVVEKMNNQYLETHNRSYFDRVMFVRPDVLFLSDVPYYLLQHFPPRTLFVPDFLRACNSEKDNPLQAEQALLPNALYNDITPCTQCEFNDRFAMGDVISATVYGKKMFSALLYSTKYLLHAERYVEFAICCAVTNNVFFQSGLHTIICGRITSLFTNYHFGLHEFEQMVNWRRETRSSSRVISTR